MIQVYRFDSLKFTNEFWEGRIICSRGTYVRTLVEDVAAHVGTSAVLEELVRERIGPYSLDQAIALDAPEFRWAPWPAGFAA